MSPLDRVSPGAVLIGPVLVGPGCIVERDAKVGPDVVLSHEVVVSTNTRIEHSLVLPNTYIDTDLDLCETIVNGARVRHLPVCVESFMAAADAVLLNLAASGDQRLSWFGRVAAIAAPTLIGPALAWHVTRCHVAGHGSGWTLRDVVSGHDARSKVLRKTPMLVPRPRAQRAAQVWAGLAGLIDLAAGRRSWFGSRPRTPGQWYALRPEWQQMLSNSMVGLLHAPAWEDVPALRAESFAIADVYATRLPQTRRAWALVSELMRAIGNRGLQNA